MSTLRFCQTVFCTCETPVKLAIRPGRNKLPRRGSMKNLISNLNNTLYIPPIIVYFLVWFEMEKRRLYIGRCGGAAVCVMSAVK